MPDSQVLTANLANALVYLIIVLAITLVILARIFAPILTRIADALIRLQEAILTTRADTEMHTRAIEHLRDDLTEGLAHLNIRFDAMPDAVRKAVIEDILREWLKRNG